MRTGWASGKGSRARSSTGGTSSRSATPAMSARADVPWESARLRACSRFQSPTEAIDWRSASHSKAKPAGVGPRPGCRQARPTYPVRSTVTPVAFQLVQEVTQRRHRLSDRQRSTGRDCRRCQPPLPHCFRQHRIRKNRTASLAGRAEFRDYPAMVGDQNRLA